MTHTPDFVLVTGLSGAGRSTSLKCFEDMGFETFDNIPPPLLGTLFQDKSGLNHNLPLGVGLDMHKRHKPSQFEELIQKLQADLKRHITVLFLECDDITLIKRYKETRRRHPLAHDRPVSKGITLERQRLAPIKEKADIILDTTTLNIWKLKERLSLLFPRPEKESLQITLASFSFKKGLPADADIVFDVRFLNNPYYNEALRPLTGKDSAVQQEIEKDKDAALFFQHMITLITFTLPRYAQEGKSHLTISFGCTGGQHRSVYMAQKTSKYLEKEGYNIVVFHRDLPLVQTDLALPHPSILPN